MRRILPTDIERAEHFVLYQRPLFRKVIHVAAFLIGIAVIVVSWGQGMLVFRLLRGAGAALIFGPLCEWCWPPDVIRLHQKGSRVDGRVFRFQRARAQRVLSACRDGYVAEEYGREGEGTAGDYFGSGEFQLQLAVSLLLVSWVVFILTSRK